MNEKELTKRKEIDLEITDFLWEIVRNWRTLLICMLAGAVFFGVYQYRKDSKAAETTPEEVVTEYTKTLEELESALGAQDLDAVYGAVSMKKQLDEKSAYVKNSPLMAVNPYEEAVVYLRYCVKSESGNASELAHIYEEYILNGEIASELIDLGADAYNTDGNARASYEYGFTVRIRGAEQEDAQALAEQVKNSLSGYKTQADGALSGHELILLKESAAVTVDQQLVQLQNDTALAVKNLTEQLDSMKSKMSGDQLALYIEYTEKEPQTGESSQTDVSEEQTDAVQEVQTVSISLSKIVLGAVLGLGLAVLWVLLHYLLMGRLHSEEEIKTLYHSRVLGTVRNSADGKRNPIDRKITECRYGQAGKMTFAEELDFISANIKIACRTSGKETVYVTGSGISGIPKEILEKLAADCKEKGITLVLGKEICYYADALEEMAAVGQVLMLETVRKSRYTQMYQEVLRCREHHIEILGMVIIGA